MMILVTREGSLPATKIVEVAGQPSGVPQTVSVSIFSEVNLPKSLVIPIFFILFFASSNSHTFNPLSKPL